MSADVDWARRFILFHHKRHPQDRGAAEVEAFLTYLAVERKVAASTQNQPKSALLFLYGQVLKLELPWLDEVTAARTQRKLPVVLTPSEVRALRLEMSGVAGLGAALLSRAGQVLPLARAFSTWGNCVTLSQEESQQDCMPSACQRADRGLLRPSCWPTA